MGDISEAEVVRRLADHHHAYVAFIDNRPAAFGWVATRRARIGELNHEFILQPGNKYLWNFRTMMVYRGLGIYPALLQYIILNEVKNGDRLWIAHAPENRASLNGIRKAGFRYVGKLYVNTKGAASFEADGNAPQEERLVKALKLEMTGPSTASCWTCSSPYIKKRAAACCCAESTAICAGPRSMAA
jgi:hypothetical protein